MRRFSLAHAAFFGPVLALVLQTARHLRSPIEAQLGIVPDDGFYYLGLARNFARSGVWSFDGGVSRTTGFHLLQAYLSAAVFRLMPGIGTESLLALHACVGMAATIAAIWILVDVVDRVFGGPAVLGVALVATSGNFLVQPSMLMEWPWVVLAGALTVAAVAREPASEAEERRNGWLVLLAALAATLARSDSPLLAGSALGAGALVRSRTGDATWVRRASYAVAGAVVGSVLVVAHNLVVAGELVQSSVTVKAHWGAVNGYSLRYAAEMAASTAAPGFWLIDIRKHSLPAVVAAHVAVVALVLAGLRLRSTRAGGVEAAAPDDRRTFLIVTAAAACIGYMLVYGKNSAAIQPWYSAQFVVPLAILYAAGLRYLASPGARIVASLLALALGLVNLAAANRPLFPPQPSMRRGGLWLAEHPLEGRVGSWNAGMLGYFSGGKVVNLDGLVNSDVAGYVVTDRLHCYLLAKDIRWVIDWQQMLEGLHPARGGYATGPLLESLSPTYVVPGSEAGHAYWKNLRLWEVDRARLERAGACD